MTYRPHDLLSAECVKPQKSSAKGGNRRFWCFFFFLGGGGGFDVFFSFQTYFLRFSVDSSHRTAEAASNQTPRRLRPSGEFPVALQSFFAHQLDGHLTKGGRAFCRKSGESRAEHVYRFLEFFFCEEVCGVTNYSLRFLDKLLSRKMGLLRLLCWTSHLLGWKAVTSSWTTLAIANNRPALHKFPNENLENATNPPASHDKNNKKQKTNRNHQKKKHKKKDPQNTQNKYQNQPPTQHTSPLRFRFKRLFLIGFAHGAKDSARGPPTNQLFEIVVLLRNGEMGWGRWEGDFLGGFGVFLVKGVFSRRFFLIFLKWRLVFSFCLWFLGGFWRF